MANISINITSGKYIDTLIRAKAKEQKLGLTEYIDNLSDEINLSSRQINRIRGSEGFPEDDAVKKLARAIPELEAIRSDTVFSRTLVPWQVIVSAQNQLIAEMENGSLTIIGGWQKPLALSDEKVITAMIPALEKGFTYNFLYPNPATYPYSEDGVGSKTVEEVESQINEWITALQQKLRGEWYKQLMNGNLSSIDSTKTEHEQLADFKEKIKIQVTGEPTYINTRFWSFLPSDYLVLYNIDDQYANLDKVSPHLRYGVFKVLGQQLRCDLEKSEDSDGVFQIESSGWLYLTKEKYQAISASYNTFRQRRAKGEDINPKDSNKKAPR
jgi:hypothetical protein